MTKYEKGIQEAFKAYYDAGCNVFLTPVSTKVGDSVAWKGFQENRPDWEYFKPTLSDGKEHNIAMICGKTSGNSIAICFNDIDTYHRFYLKEGGDAMKFTRTHSSQRGFHTFIKTEEDVGLVCTPDYNIEIRGNGACVMIPPSKHPNGGFYRSLNPDVEIAFIPDFWDWIEERCFAAGYLLVDKKFIRPPDDIQQILKGPLEEHSGREPKMFRLACYLTEFWDREKIRQRLYLLNDIIGKPSLEEKLMEKAVRDAFKEQYVKSREQKRKQKEEKGKILPIAFETLEDESLAELVYDTQRRKGQLLVYRNNEVTYVDKIEDRGRVLIPKVDTFVEKSAIRLPSGIEGYGTRDELINRMEGFVKKYIEYPESHLYRFTAYYVLMTWLYDRFNTVFYLRHTGAMGSGKTTAGEVLGSVCYKGILMGGNITSAGLFRLMDSWRGTLIIDEAEFRAGSDVYDGILQVLNVGYKNGGYVIRQEKDFKGNYTSIPYMAYGPKIIASRTGTEMATESRMITITMRPRTKRTESEDFLETRRDEFEAQALSLRNQFLKYRLDNFSHLTPIADKNINDARLRAMLIPIFTLSQGDRKMDAILSQIVQDYREEMDTVKSESLLGIIAETIVDIYNNRGGVSVGEIVDYLRDRRYQISDEWVGRSIRKELRLKATRRQVEGRREQRIEISQGDVKRLIREYNLSPKEKPARIKKDEL